jgi:hypothetical protein
MKNKSKTENKAALTAPQWHATNGTYITGESFITEMDKVAWEMEKHWGAGRLRLLVDAELRDKFDRQRYLVNNAIWHGDLEAVRQQSKRMISAWKALDRAARENGAAALSPTVWEIALPGGSVMAVVQTVEEMRAVQPNGRDVQVYALEEIARIVAAQQNICAVKDHFPGALVTAIRRSHSDPLDGIPDSKGMLDDPLEDVGAFEVSI